MGLLRDTQSGTACVAQNACGRTELTSHHQGAISAKVLPSSASSFHATHPGCMPCNATCATNTTCMQRSMLHAQPELCCAVRAVCASRGGHYKN